MAAELLTPRDGFLGIGEDDASAPADAPKAVIIPFGLEKTVSFGTGTGRGPQAIIEASHQVELFDDELWCEPSGSFHVDTLREPAIPEGMDDALALLADLTGSALDDGAFPLTLGGEHSITPGALRPFLRKWPDLALLHFDAHADLRDGYEGEPYSHAAAIRRCMDAPDLEVVSIGIRNISAGEIPFVEANRHRLHIHWARDMRSWTIAEMLAPLEGRPIYITFDLDGFDASLMPATGTPEPGGLFWADVMPILRRACEIGQVVGADINELAPVDALHGCDFLAAKLVHRLLAMIFAQRA